METSRYLKILWGRRWVILLTTIAAAAVVALLAFRQDPVYTATTKMRVVPFGINAPDYGTFVYFDRLVSTYAELVQSDVITGPAKEQLGIDELPRYSIETIPQTELMRLDVTSEDPELAANVANMLTELLVEQNRQISTAGLIPVEQSLGDQIAEIERQTQLLTQERARLQVQIPQDTVRIAEIDRELASLQLRYTPLLQSFNQVQISRSAQASSLTIVQRAAVPTEPSSVGPLRTTIIGGVVGLLGGLALAFIVEATNPRLYTNLQIEAVAQANITGRIPRIRRKYRKDVFRGDPVAAEAFRRLRTTVMSVSRNGGEHNGHPRLLLVASALPGEGKSTIAANLARSMARNQQSVVLVDCDMRRPTQHTIFGISNDGDSLSNVLLDKSSFDEAAEGVGMQNLKLIPAGVSTFNSTELLASQKMSALTAYLLEHFDVVIFDGPAILAAPDSVALAPLVDGVLLVLDPRRTNERSLALAREQLKQVGGDVLGVVLNRTKPDIMATWPTYSIMRSS